ncbi:MAG: TonB-dependent receptor [Acidobacteria bacterium]|nr:TonB-dependent receptor [Acidobacteriota bacterium]
MLRRVSVVGFFCILMLLGNKLAYSQRTTANLYGTVKDATGAVIPGATVTLTNELTGGQVSATSNEFGEFTAAFVPVGRYEMRVEVRGFKTYVQRGIELSANQQIRFPVTLEVGGLTEVTTVTAEAPILQSAAVQLVDRFSRLQLNELPQGKRDFTALLDLQNGVRFDKQGLFTVNGLAPGGMSISVDGVDAAGDPETPSVSQFQGFNIINVMSQEAIQEVSVSKGVMSAEIGRTFSGNINVISKTGTNNFHGSLFETFQNEVLNAWNGWTPQNLRPAPIGTCVPDPSKGVTCKKTPIRYNQFGGSVGGPIIKDKLFFFFTYEGYRNHSSSIGVITVPTPEMKAKAVAAVPDYKEVLDLWMNPTDPYVAGANSSTARYVTNLRQNDNHFVGRGDWQINPNNTLAGRFTAGNPDQVTPRTPPTNPRVYTGTTRSANLTWTHSRSRWTSEARLGLNFNDTHREDKIHSDYRFPGIDIRRDVTISVDGESLILAGHTYTIEEVMATTKGRHTLKLGGAYHAATPGRYDEEVPIYRYANLNDFYANKPERARYTFGQPRYYGRAWDLGFFLQDDFRLRPNVVLNLGLRYEYYSTFKEKDDKLYNPGTIANALKVPAVFLPPDSIYKTDKNNFLPRVGLSWGLGKGQKTVIRSGFGVTVAPHNLRNFSSLVYVDESIPFRFDFTGSDIARLGLKYPISNQQVLDIMSKQDVPRGYRVWEQDSPNPYTLQWMLDVQQEIRPTLVVQLGYVGNRANKITMAHNANYPDRVTGERPFPAVLTFGYDDPSDFSYYHALQASVRKRLSNRYSFNFNYTWSKAMAIAQGDFWAGNNTRVQDENNYQADLGPTDNDRTHVASADLIYDTPFGNWLGTSTTLRRATGWVVGGWRFAGILRANSGRPLNVVQRSAYEFSRPDRSDGDPYYSAPDPGYYSQWYLNPATFIRVPEGKGGPLRPGNMGKNALRAPGYWNIDISIVKSFRIREEMAFDVRAEMFNFLNHPNLGSPEVDVTRPLFGRITGVTSPRTMQISLKFVF